MGQITSRQRSHDDNAAASASHAFKYPPKSGSYFGSHFLIGGERFEISQPESYLFGDNNEINFFGAKPVQFPYPQPSSTEPVIPLYCNVAVRRDSLKFVRAQASDGASGNGEDFDDHLRYNIEFIFDCDVPCTITIYYFAIEKCTPTGLQYISSRPELTSKPYKFDMGAGRIFNQKDHVFDPMLFRIEELQYNSSTEIAPIVIHCVVDSPDTVIAQSQSTLAVVDRSAEGHGFVLKALKQKQMVDGVCYLIQDIFGIENKHQVPNSAATAPTTSSTNDTNSNGATGTGSGTGPADEYAENGAECVVCMSELRDTIILPCRHLCMCSACAETLRYKASNCPICRSPFRALFQIKTIRRKIVYSRCGSPSLVRSSTHNYPEFANFANRYETVPLMECLNGPVEGSSGITLPRMPRIPAAQNQPGAGQGAAQTHSHPPRVPPRRGHRRRKHVKPAVPIQEVLTPQTIATKPEKLELSIRRIRSIENPKLPGQMESSCDELDTTTYVIDLKSNGHYHTHASDNENSDSSYVTPVTNVSTPQNTAVEFQRTPTPLGHVGADEEDLKSVSSREEDRENGGPSEDEEELEEGDGDEVEGREGRLGDHVTSEDDPENDGPGAKMDDTAMSSVSGSSSSSTKPLLVSSCEIKV